MGSLLRRIRRYSFIFLLFLRCVLRYTSFVLDLVKNNMVLAQKLESEVCSNLRKLHDVKRMSKKQKVVAAEISEIVMANELPQDWISKAKEYCENAILKRKDKKATDIVSRIRSRTMVPNT